MKKYLFYLFITTGLYSLAQDKIYFLNGDRKVAKVLEIGPDEITVVPISESGAPFVDANEVIPKWNILLIEYKSGAVEIYNTPYRDVVMNPNGTENKTERIRNGQEPVVTGFVSLNTAALCNSDISGFFEKLSSGKKIGFGGMAAYNFNRHAALQNPFISILSNAKKQYDIGAFINFYPAHFKKRSTFYYGVFFKYTALKFTRVIEEHAGTAVNLKYEPAQGSQLATIFTIGIHTYITKNVFIKSIVGIGGFNLRGIYKEQFNYFANQDRKPTDPYVNYKFLPKVYLGINLGFNL